MKWLLLSTLLFVSLSRCGEGQGETTADAPVNVISQEIEAAQEPIVIPPTDGFDFPIGPPDAKGYYNAQKFMENAHLGEDWNGVGGGNTDLGDPVYATAKGLVHFAEDHGPGWGNIIRIHHNIGDSTTPDIIESLYAHLDTMHVAAGEFVKKGQQIGTIGNADGAYYAHLHFEMRWDTSLPIGGGYAVDTAGFLVPTAFIKAHRKR